MATWAITGVSGYLGQALVGRAIDLGVEIVGVDVRPPPVHPDGLHFFQRDVRDPGLAEIFGRYAPDVVVHLAAVLNPIYDADRAFSIDVGGTQNVLHAARAAKTRHIVVTSSATAYGAHPDNPVPLHEDHPLRATPDFDYAYHKRLVEEHIEAFKRAYAGVTVTTIRPCILAGPNVANYIAMWMFGMPFVGLPGGADPPLQFLHEDDAAAFVVKAVERPFHGALNAAGDGTVRLSQLALLTGRRTISVPEGASVRAFEWMWRARLLRQATPAATVRYMTHPWVVDIARAREAIGFIPRHTSGQCVDITYRHVDELRDQVRRRLDAVGRDGQSWIGGKAWDAARWFQRRT